jgi:hypothetical protein
LANKKKSQKTKASKTMSVLPPAQPWIPMRNAVIIISLTSIGMAVLTGLQVVPAKGWGEGILWSLLFGGMIWAIFFGLFFVNKFLRR